MTAADLPSAKQRRYLQGLYAQLGKPTPEPETRAGASAAISHAREQLAVRFHPIQDEPCPTAGQLHDLAVLARRAGEAPPQPSTVGDAARELARLRSASP
jgi:hypothetical protein